MCPQYAPSYSLSLASHLPFAPPQEHKKKVKSWEEPIKDNTEKQDRPFKLIEKPQFEPVEKPVPKEHKKKVKSYEEPIEDNTKKPNKMFKKIHLPEFEPKPVEEPPKLVRGPRLRKTVVLCHQRAC
jgi:hypothetical protein